MVGNHQGSQSIRFDKSIRQLHQGLTRLGIESSCMLIQEQEFRTLQGSHQQAQSLTLSTR